MQKFNQVAFLENPELYEMLKDNSYYFKYLNRGEVDIKRFNHDMKALYKRRTTDKLESLIDNMDMISSVLNILK